MFFPPFSHTIVMKHVAAKSVSFATQIGYIVPGMLVMTRVVSVRTYPTKGENNHINNPRGQGEIT
jgi:hypothetical protein